VGGVPWWGGGGGVGGGGGGGGALIGCEMWEIDLQALESVLYLCEH